MSSSAWSGGASIERRERPEDGLALPGRAQPASRRGPILSPDCRREPRTIVDLLRGAPPPPRHRGVRVHLPVLRGPSARGDQSGDADRALRDVREQPCADAAQQALYRAAVYSNTNAL